MNKSLFTTLSITANLVEEKLREVSSANKRAIPVRLSVISIILIKNKSGPKTDPCGTPAEIGFSEEYTPFTNTFWCIFDK